MKRGEFLFDKRTKKGLSVSALAQKLGVSEAEVWQWESGALPDSEYLLRLSEVLDIPVEDILQGGDSADAADMQEIPEAEETQSGAEIGASDAPGVREQGSEEENSRSFECGRPRNGEEEPSAPQENARQASFCEILQEKSCYSDSPASEDAGIGSGCNGYSSGERIFGYMLFAVFTVVAVIMLAVQFAGWVSRPRELTMENYGDFVEIDIVAAESFNPDEYIVRVTAKEVMTNLRITVRVTFWSFRGNEFSETVTVAAAVLSEGGTAGEPIHISEIALDRGFEVLSVEGDLE